jgi:hypothetical protein
MQLTDSRRHNLKHNAARTREQDVRDVVRSYDGEEDVAAAFKARMARMEKQKGGGGRLSRMRG